MNKYFIYEGSILRAAQSKLWNALKYYKSGRVVLYGSPELHELDITRVAKKLILPK
ncbi:MAG: hypothetical protein ABI091_26965 [Ferruginibacter sp.]